MWHLFASNFRTRRSILSVKLDRDARRLTKMADSRRSSGLTTLAILFAILALTDLLKPFHLEGPTTGLVFFGTRLSGMSNAVLGPLLGIFLLIYAAGIWQMRRYAIYLAYVYAAYVAINLLLFTATNPPPASR